MANHFKILSADDPTRGWSSVGGSVKLVPVADAETFEQVSGSTQSMRWRRPAHIGMYLRHDTTHVIVCTDNTVDANTFDADSSFAVSPGTKNGSVVIHSLNLPTMAINTRGDGTLVLVAGRGADWLFQVTDNLAQTQEGTAPPTATPSGFTTTDQHTIALGEKSSSTGTRDMTEDDRNHILNDTGSGLLAGSSSTYGFDQPVPVPVPVPVAVVTTTKPADEGMSALAITAIVIAVVIAVGATVYLAKKYRLVDKVMMYFKK